MRKEKRTKSSGNVFVDLGFSPEEVTLLTMRADLMARLRLSIESKNWTQAQAAAQLGVSQSRVSDLVRGKWEKFSLDMLLVLASRAGLKPGLKLGRAA
jgi:predicted XRE-type DNA-binding protein